MNLDDVKTLIDLLENHPLEEIQYSFSSGESVHLVKEKKYQSHHTLTQNVPHTVQSDSDCVPTKDLTEHKSTSFHQIKSPIVGTFYAAASPDKPPFVKEGDTVENGQTLCIIEAMKILNPVTAPHSGVVRKIYVENENPVEYHQVLFDIEPL